MVSSFPLAEGRLAQRVCAPLALNRINLSFFTHVAGDRQVLCTAAPMGEAAFTLIRSQAEPGAATGLSSPRPPSFPSIPTTSARRSSATSSAAWPGPG